MWTKPPPLLSSPPVLGQAGCVGHLLRSAKGLRGFDRDRKEIGTFENVAVATQALLDLAIDA